MAQVIQRSLSEEVLDKTMNLFWEKGVGNFIQDFLDDMRAKFRGVKVKVLL